MLISEEYRRQNAEMFAKKPNYGTSGSVWAKTIGTIAEHAKFESILDYGCGRGTLFEAMREFGFEFTYRSYDPAIREVSMRPVPADFVTCTDVLEHIEPECLDAVLDDIASLAKRAIFLVIATTPAKKHLPDGRNAHLIIEPPKWWLPKITARWNLFEFKVYAHCFSCIAKTK